MLALALLLVGFVFAAGRTIEALPMYALLWDLLPKGVWAAGALFVGALRLVFLYWNGAYRRSPHFRAIGAGLSCFCWLALAVGVWSSPLAGATVVIWPLFFIFDLHIALSAAGEAARNDVRAQAEVAAGGDDEPGLA